MANWNEFFIEPRNIKLAPEAEIYRFAQAVESAFPARPLRIWDLCCGAGRHTVALARLGHALYASDHAPNAVRLTQAWVTDLGLPATIALSDMTVCPWPKVTFHGVVSWDALYHNTRAQIQRAIQTVHERLVPGGFFLVTLKSTQADLYGHGEAIEPNTYLMPEGAEAGIPHHYSDEAEIRAFFQGWEVISLAEQIIHYVERGRAFLESNPFPYTTWGVFACRAA